MSRSGRRGAGRKGRDALHAPGFVARLVGRRGSRDSGCEFGRQGGPDSTPRETAGCGRAPAGRTVVREPAREPSEAGHLKPMNVVVTCGTKLFRAREGFIYEQP